MDNRALSPVVGKVLAAGLAVLYIGVTTSLLLGGVVPEYRAAASHELGERVLATGAETVEGAVPDIETRVSVRHRADLPATIQSAAYDIELVNGTLHLDHPNDAVDCYAGLQLPSNVSVADGKWESGGPLVVRVTGAPGNRTVWLEGGGP